ncbi:MAG TPA: serine O-acetyltransferase [Solirubrobacterales bacterium]|jgi:serine O-acetyltransferase|nr:serine O-acetyltransferase [Solirubrobacterales bacterium]
MTRIAREIRQDIAAAQARDPATRGLGRLEVLATYNGVHAILLHRVANAIAEAGVPLLPRMISYVSRIITGVEIHPKATIGENFFIDHGAGVVVGETAEIGNNVTLYQGVTLGGTGLEPGKRHPTVEDNVTVGSGAKLLGPIRIGHGAKIGANSVVIHDVPPNTTVVGNPGHPVRINGQKPEEGPDNDWIHLPDPVADALTALSDRLLEAERTIAELRGEDPPGSAPKVRPLRRSKGHDPTGG